MNIFFLDYDPKKCAQYHLDKHVVKMIVETAQMLYSVHWFLELSLPSSAYKKAHINHPCSIWARTSLENYLSTKYAFSSSKYVCEFCEYVAKNQSAMSAHKRGCKINIVTTSENENELVENISTNPEQIVIDIVLPSVCEIKTSDSNRKQKTTKTTKNKK